VPPLATWLAGSEEGDLDYGESLVGGQELGFEVLPVLVLVACFISSENLNVALNPPYLHFLQLREKVK
jgi:prepilin signal peptidase PulO-like enzyme (type II secretory pathway)